MDCHGLRPRNDGAWLTRDGGAWLTRNDGPDSLDKIKDLIRQNVGKIAGV
jgi:hypothetical protein